MISREEIQSLAQLARLKLTPAEEESLQKDISNIVEYIGQVSAVSATGASAAPAVSPLAPRNVMRDDAPRAEESVMAKKEEALRAALPKRENEYNVVRKIIQKDE